MPHDPVTVFGETVHFPTAREFENMDVSRQLKWTFLANRANAEAAARAGVVETPTIARVTANGTVPAGAKSLTFVTSKASPAIGNGVDFAGSILGTSRLPGEVITIPVQPGNTLTAVAYTITGGGSLDIIKTV